MANLLLLICSSQIAILPHFLIVSTASLAMDIHKCGERDDQSYECWLDYFPALDLVLLEKKCLQYSINMIVAAQCHGASSTAIPAGTAQRFTYHGQL
jgi:hypothetical protein